MVSWLAVIHKQPNCISPCELIKLWFAEKVKEGQQLTVCSHFWSHIQSSSVTQYLCLSCRCRAGCSCRARRSTCRPHGQWSPRSPPRLQRSYPAGSPSSSHIPAWQQTTRFSICFSFVNADRVGISKDEHVCAFFFLSGEYHLWECTWDFAHTWAHGFNQEEFPMSPLWILNLLPKLEQFEQHFHLNCLSNLILSHPTEFLTLKLFINNSWGCFFFFSKFRLVANWAIIFLKTTET